MPRLLVAVGIILVVVFGTIYYFYRPAQANVTENNSMKEVTLRSVDVEEFSASIKEEGAILLDIRTPEEYSLSKIPGAVNINYYDTFFREELGKLDKTKKYNIYCNSGKRSTLTLQIMQGMGFENVIDLKGGIQAWIQSGKGVD